MDKLFRAPEPFSFDGTDVGQRWTRWDKSFRTFFKASEYKKKPKDIQVAILLNCAGAEAQEIHEQFQFENPEEEKDIDVVLQKFEEYCHPRKNTVYERYKFWCRNQSGDEAIDKWVKDLRTIAANCEFGDQENSLIRDKIVFGVRDNRTKERMLRESDLTLVKALEICRAAESTKAQMREMTTQSKEESTSVDELRDNSSGRRIDSKFPDEHRERRNDYRSECEDRGGSKNRADVVQCFNCSGYGHYSRDCPNGDSFPRGRRNRGQNNSRGNRGGRSRGGGRGRRYQLNKVSEEHDQYEDQYADQFQEMSLDSLTIETKKERGRSPVRGDGCFRSRGRSRAHKGLE